MDSGGWQAIVHRDTKSWTQLKGLSTHASSNPTPGQISKQNYNSKRYNSQDMEATEMSIDKRMDKEDVVHMYNGILLSHKKE